MFDGLVACAVDRWRHDSGARRAWLFYTARVTNERRFVLGTFRSEQMRVLYRSRQNARLRVMLFHAEIVEIGGVAIYFLSGEFHRAKSYCHLYGAQGQRQAYF
ncbi:hypothetical protein TNCV_1982601 [Trichonephila clavipes]|nr:hypothetical protein TNCV_1982601 [Trichonephila clavipes]